MDRSEGEKPKPPFKAAVSSPSRREAARREQHPQGVRRIRKAAELPTAAQARRNMAYQRDSFAASAATYFAHVGKVGKTPPGLDWM